MFIIIFLHDLAIIILGYPPFSDTSGPPKSSLLCKPVPYLFTIKAGLASLNSAGSTWQSESKFGHRSPLVLCQRMSTAELFDPTISLRTGTAQILRNFGKGHRAGPQSALDVNPYYTARVNRKDLYNPTISFDV